MAVSSFRLEGVGRTMVQLEFYGSLIHYLITYLLIYFQLGGIDLSFDSDISFFSFFLIQSIFNFRLIVKV